MADVVLARPQIVVDRDPAIKDETFALPATLRARHLFEIAKNAALQVVHFFKAEILHQRAGLLAADTASTEHGQLLSLVFWVRCQLFGPIRKFAKAVCFGVNRPDKASYRRLIAIASVDYQYVRVVDKRVPIGRFDVGASGFSRLNLGASHRDDFAFQSDFHAKECLFRRGRKFE